MFRLKTDSTHSREVLAATADYSHPRTPSQSTIKSFCLNFNFLSGEILQLERKTFAVHGFHPRNEKKYFLCGLKRSLPILERTKGISQKFQLNNSKISLFFELLSYRLFPLIFKLTFDGSLRPTIEPDSSRTVNESPADMKVPTARFQCLIKVSC